MYITLLTAQYVMKRFFILISIASICFGCVNNSNKANESKITVESNFPSDKLEFASFTDTTVYHIANIDSMPCLNVTFDITYPLATGVAGNDQLLVKDFIANCVGKEYANKVSVEDAVKAFTNSEIKRYKSEVCGSTPEAKIVGESWMNYEYFAKNNILYNAHGILSYSCYVYTFTGGAHGMNTTSCYVYDVYENQEIGINSIFKEESLPNVLSLIKEQLALHEGAESIDMSYVNVTENFYADETGIHWIYNPYEIAPYAVGSIEVVLPYSKIENYFLENTPIKSIL